MPFTAVFTPQVDFSVCSLPFFLLASHSKFLEPRGHLALAPCDIPLCGPVLGWRTWRREALFHWKPAAIMAFYKAPNDFWETSTC